MSSLTEKLGIVVSAEDLASGKLGKVKSELAGLGGASKTSASGLLAHGGAMAKVESSAGRLGATLGNLRARVGGLASSFGTLAGVGGLLSIAGLLKGSIDEAAGMGLEMEKLTALTGMSVEKTSALAAVFGKFGLEAAQVEKIVGFEEKTLGKLSETSGKAGKSTALLALENQKLNIQLAGGKTKAIDAQIAHQKALDAVNNLRGRHQQARPFDQQHGIVLADTTGKALDFGTVLGRVADYYNSNRSAGEKAVVAATVFGKSYQNMIPILKLGSKGIAEAETAAKALGLTLTAGNAKDLRDYTANMRELGDAGHGLQLQIGLAVVPALGELAKAATGFLASGGKDAIVGFFRSGVGFARDMGGAIKTFIVPAFGAIAGAWNAIPGPLKQLLLTGLIANKVLKMTIGFDPLDMARKAADGRGRRLLRQGRLARQPALRQGRDGRPRRRGWRGRRDPREGPADRGHRRRASRRSSPRSRRSAARTARSRPTTRRSSRPTSRPRPRPTSCGRVSPASSRASTTSRPTRSTCSSRATRSTSSKRCRRASRRSSRPRPPRPAPAVSTPAIRRSCTRSSPRASPTRSCRGSTRSTRTSWRSTASSRPRRIRPGSRRPRPPRRAT